MEVFGIKRWRSPLENIAHIQDKITLLDSDLTDLSSVISVLRQVNPDRIYHLAAQSFVPFSYTNPRATIDTNITGTLNLLEAIRILNQKPELIHICSSSEVYGQPEYTPMDEKHPLNPISPYGVSKVGQDRLAYAYYKAYGMPIILTRMFTHTGPRQHKELVISSFAHQIARIEKGLQKPVVFTGNLDSVRTIADVRDTVRAYWLLRPDMAGEVYNIGGEISMTIRQLLTCFSALTDAKFEIQVEKSRLRPIDVTLQIPDSSKFKKATWWEPETNFWTTLRDILEYWRNRV